MSTPPSIRVVVKLPWNRPENAPLDPPQIEWTPEKADILWKVIERSRSTESEGADWKGLAAHLEVPLPYILYRVHARFQDELRGLQDIQGALNPSTSQHLHPKSPDELVSKERPTIITGRSVSTVASRLSSSSRLSTPVNVRARLNSLGNNSPRPKKATSSSTLTVQGAVKKQHTPLQPTSHSSSEEESDPEEDEAEKEEEAERNAEEQEVLDRKLQELQKMMTNEALGLVSSSRPKDKGSYRRDGFSSQSLSSRSASQSVSSAGSPQGSIPEIPSPNADSQPHSPLGKHMSPVKSSSPPAISARSALSHTHRRYGPLVDRSSEPPGSSHGSSEASSFSDLSDASLSSVSALESALMSNTRGTGSRIAHFRSRLRGGRGDTMP